MSTAENVAGLLSECFADFVNYIRTLRHRSEYFNRFVNYIRTLRDRSEYFNRFINYIRTFNDRSFILLAAFAAMFVIFIAGGPPLLIENCHRAPGIGLSDFAIRDMAVFHNTTATNSTPWQVSSDINLTFSFRNRNAVILCFTTLLRMEVSVYYAGNSTISVSDVPLEFALKPERSRGVSTEMLEARFLIMNDSVGSAMAADLRSDNITLQLEFATQYLQSDGTIKWIRSFCEVVARTPLKTNSRPESLVARTPLETYSRPESLLSMNCVI